MTVLGIDISKWDGNWDAEKAKQAGATFVFIKASEATFTDPQFLVNWQKAKEAGLLRGAYHYLDYTKPGAEQANYFADLLINDPGELPPIIDYELRRTDNDPSAAIGFLRDCLDQLITRTELFENASNKYPMIYTGPGFWMEYGDQTKRDYWIQFPLWNAHWTSSTTPKIPPPWTMWHFWQFTSKGPGEAFGSECLSMDMNRYNGTLNELMEFAGMNVPVVNLNEKYELLDGKVKKLEAAVSSINQNGNASTSDTLDRIDALDGQVSNLNVSIATLSAAMNQRIIAIEKTIIDLGNTPTTPPVPTVSTVGAPVQTVHPVSDPNQADLPATPQVQSDVPSKAVDPTDLPPDQPILSDLPTDTSISPNPANNISPNAICITSALNIRSGPGSSHSIVGGLRYGQRVKIINHEGGWAQLQEPAGWCSEAYLSFEQSDSPAQEETSQSGTTSNTYGICNTSGLNVRGGPGVTNSIVGGLIYGQRIKILNHKNGWAQIEAPAGWCNESYLSFA
jgi:lysozyme